MCVGKIDLKKSRATLYFDLCFDGKRGFGGGILYDFIVRGCVWPPLD